MKKALAFLCLVAPAMALAQSDLVVTSKPLPKGIQLDAGSGPKDFICVKGKITHKVNLAGRIVNTSGTFLILTFDLQDQHLSMEVHNQQRPLRTNQVRLTCDKKDQVQVKVGSEIELAEAE